MRGSFTLLAPSTGFNAVWNEEFLSYDEDDGDQADYSNNNGNNKKYNHRRILTKKTGITYFH